MPGLVAARWPDLPFGDGAFDIALSSHLLFLYSAQFDLAFHIRALEDDAVCDPPRRGNSDGRHVESSEARPQDGGPTMTTTRYPEAGAHDTLWPEDRIETLLPAGCFDAEPAGEPYTQLLLGDAPGKGSGADSPTIRARDTMEAQKQPRHRHRRIREDEPVDTRGRARRCDDFARRRQLRLQSETQPVQSRVH